MSEKRFIDPNAIKITGNTFKDENGEVFIALSDVRQAIAQTPTADVKEVVRGEWVNCKYFYGLYSEYNEVYKEQCSVCKEWSKEYGSNFCSNCGADMRGDKG